MHDGDPFACAGTAILATVPLKNVNRVGVEPAIQRKNQADDFRNVAGSVRAMRANEGATFLEVEPLNSSLT